MKTTELHYYTKEGERIFEECKNKNSAKKLLKNLKKENKIDTERDVAICQFNEDGDLI